LRAQNLERTDFAPAAVSQKFPEIQEVEQAQSGDGDAYARLIERYQGPIAQQMWRFTRDPDRHAELVEDVFVNAYGSLRSYRGAAPFLHWLRKIAVRTGYAHWRQEKRSRRERPLDEEAARTLADAPADHDAREAGELVHRVLAELPPRDRLALTLMYLEERSVAEIAGLTGWSVTMVKVQLWRSRAKLKKALLARGFSWEG
jgi:RNA polymerase sigma-70 factor (ECF subfamily)